LPYAACVAKRLQHAKGTTHINKRNYAVCTVVL
jgi:hypothetical protein